MLLNSKSATKKKKMWGKRKTVTPSSWLAHYSCYFWKYFWCRKTCKWCNGHKQGDRMLLDRVLSTWWVFQTELQLCDHTQVCQSYQHLKYNNSVSNGPWKLFPQKQIECLALWQQQHNVNSINIGKTTYVGNKNETHKITIKTRKCTLNSLNSKIRSGFNFDVLMS